MSQQNILDSLTASAVSPVTAARHAYIVVVLNKAFQNFVV